MKKQKVVYRYFRYDGKPLHARREIPFEIKLSSRLLLDELCFNWNKNMLEAAINRSIDNRDKDAFIKCSKAYTPYIRE